MGGRKPAVEMAKYRDRGRKDSCHSNMEHPAQAALVYGLSEILTSTALEIPFADAMRLKHLTGKAISREDRYGFDPDWHLPTDATYVNQKLSPCMPVAPTCRGSH